MDRMNEARCTCRSSDGSTSRWAAVLSNGNFPYDFELALRALWNNGQRSNVVDADTESNGDHVSGGRQHRWDLFSIYEEGYSGNQIERYT